MPEPAPNRGLSGEKSAPVRGGSADAVGAEQHAELGVDAVAGLAVELVAEAEHRLLLGADHAHEHGAVPG